MAKPRNVTPPPEAPAVMPEVAPAIAEAPAPAPAPAFAFDLADLKIELSLAVTHKPGADLSLHAYPLLVHAPDQHGQGVRTEDNGTPVADIVAKAAELPDYDQLAEHFGTTRQHVEQAIAYAVAVSPAPARA